LLCAYCELCALRERAAFELEQCTVQVDSKNGRQVLSPWFQVHASTTKAMTAMSARLRIGPRSRMKQASAKSVAPVSAYEEMRSKPGWDKFDD
jgi:hypothetical protein